MFYDIGVRPFYQRKGVGQMIVEKLISQVKNRGYANIGLSAWEENQCNIEFYKKFGFEVVGTGMELAGYMKKE